VAKELDLTESALRNWVREAEDNEGKEPTAGVLSTAEREELVRLRKENRQLQMERDFLEKSSGLLREGGLDVKFELIDAQKAHFPWTSCASSWACRAQATTPGSSARSPSGTRRTGPWARW
jgi:transposase